MEVTDYLANRWGEFAAAISPSGRWVAYVSDQDGSDEVYVSAFPRPEGSVKVSVDGGATPVWAPDGEYLYYRTLTGDFVRAEGRSEEEFEVIAREPMFAGSRYYQYGPGLFAQYDVHPDGDRFVMLKLPEQQSADLTPVVIQVTNWLDELRRTMGVEEP